jgi:hypothetical protein
MAISIQVGPTAVGCGEFLQVYNIDTVANGMKRLGN